MAFDHKHAELRDLLRAVELNTIQSYNPGLWMKFYENIKKLHSTRSSNTLHNIAYSCIDNTKIRNFGTLRQGRYI